MADEVPSTHRKGLALNLDRENSGAIAEIGPGERRPRWCIRLGGAAGTIAKGISGCDMAGSAFEQGRDGAAERPGHDPDPAAPRRRAGELAAAGS